MTNRCRRVAALGALCTAVLWPAAREALADGHDSASTASHFQTKGFDLGDPVTANAGAFHFDMPFLDLGGPLPLRYVLDYRTDRYNDVNVTGIDGPFGSTLNRWLDRVKWGDGPVTVQVSLGGGELPVFTPAAGGSGGWTLDAASPVRYVLLETGASYDAGFFYLMDPVRENVLVFEKKPIGGWCSSAEACTSRLVAVLDRNGNAHTWTYAAADVFRPARVADGLQRWLDFAYDGRSRLVSVTDQAGRRIVFTPEAEAADCPTWNNRLQPVLRSVADAEGNVTTFHYACAPGSVQLIGGVERPAGNVPYTQTYGQLNLNGVAWERRVASQTDAYGNATTLAYAADTNRVTEARPDGETVAYEHYHNDGVPSKLTDPAGNAAELGQSANEQIATVTDRLGDATTMTYHALSGLLTSVTNAEGQTTTWTYTAQEQTLTNPVTAEPAPFTFYNLTRVDHPDATFETFTHDARGNVLTHTDSAGRTWTFSYNGRGQVLTATNPTGGVTTYTYNADATPATRSDSDTGVTAYGYDAYKRMDCVTFPGGATANLAYDLNSRPTSLTDENGRETAFAYDANGNLVAVTDAAGGEVRYGYDLMDRLVGSTDRLGKQSTRSYDVMSRLAEAVDASGVKASFQYDPRGWLDRVTRAGRTWTTTFDAEGVPTAHATPLGLATAVATDRLGLIESVTDPAGNAVTVARDGMNRVTAVTDANQLVTAYTWTPRGLLSGVTLPTLAGAAYAYNGLGLPERITDLDGSEWSFGYTPMGRLQSVTDPLERVTQRSYDARGRLSAVTYPGGGTQALTRDEAGNTTRRLYAGGPDLQFAFDARNLLESANDVALTRDAEGRVVATADAGTVFGATWDDAGRLASATYDNGAFAVTYTYDVGASGTGLLTGVGDSLTGTQIAFGYDDDRRLRTVTLPNGETVTRTWDVAGRLTRLQSGDYVDLALGYDPAGRVTGVEMIAPLTPEAYLLAGTVALTYDAASQVSSPGHAHDARGRATAAPGHALTWDGASRLTTVDGAVLTYNGLGNLRTRTSAAAATRFYYNEGIDLAPIVAERDLDSGQMLRYYVWTPGGRLLYMIDAAGGNQVYFYHFDQVGSTLALTDAAGEIADAYAYDPYGRLLRHEGGSRQPFTFVGAWGVRQEGDSGTLYQMRARYYDAKTGRFLSPEPIWPRLSAPEALNPYQYAGANPVCQVDPTGLQNVYGLHEPELEKALDDLWTQQADISQEMRFLREDLEELEEDRARGQVAWEDQVLAGLEAAGVAGAVAVLQKLFDLKLDPNDAEQLKRIEALLPQVREARRQELQAQAEMAGRLRELEMKWDELERREREVIRKIKIRMLVKQAKNRGLQGIRLEWYVNDMADWIR